MPQNLVRVQPIASKELCNSLCYPTTTTDSHLGQDYLNASGISPDQKFSASWL